jgi:superfamily II DNA or RNA helicase
MELYDYQIPCYERAQQILDTRNFCFIISEMGTGKSVVAMKIANSYTKTLVISMPSVISQNWRGICKTHNLQYELLSINILRGMKNSDLQHTYLTREDTPFSTIKARYTPTKTWTQLRDTLVIIDEIQMIKNDNLGYHAMKCLINTNPHVKFLALTGTPIDCESQIMNYYDLFAISLQQNIQSFTNIFLNEYTTNMAPVNMKFNGFIKILKSQSVLDYICERAVQNTNCKVIIALFYIADVEYVHKRLRRYKPQVITGDTPIGEREIIIAKFQQHDRECNMLIANIDIISTGINLDDTHGDFPRICYTPLNDKAMITHQLRFRITRVSTKSLSVIELVTSESDVRKLIGIDKKSEIMSNVMCSTFPGDYEIEIIM